MSEYKLKTSLAESEGAAQEVHYLRERAHASGTDRSRKVQDRQSVQ